MPVSTVPTLYQHTIVSGSDYEALIPVDPAIDVTSATAYSQIRDRFGEVVTEFVCTIPNPSVRQIKLTLPAVESLKLSEHKTYNHTLEILDSQGRSIYLHTGEVLALRGALNSDSSSGNGSGGGGGSGNGGGSSSQEGIYSPDYAAASSLSALRIVRINALGQLIYSNSSNPQHVYGAIGILLVAVSAGQSASVLQKGVVTDSSWNWNAGQPIFLGIDGAMTQLAPEEGFILPVAIALTSIQIDFEIQDPTLIGAAQ